MWNLLRPDQYAPSLYDIDFESLRDKGIRGLILDLDNTLVPWGEDTVSEELTEKIKELKQLGFGMCIVSNNLGGRVNSISSRLGIEATSGALKPLTFAYKKALRVLGSDVSTTALVGDQLFTDILGGNLVGLYTVLVDPIVDREFLTTRLLRRLERVVRKRLGLVRRSV